MRHTVAGLSDRRWSVANRAWHRAVATRPGSSLTSVRFEPVPLTGEEDRSRSPSRAKGAGCAPSRLALLAAVLVLSVLQAQAQDVRRLQTGFERDVNRYRWVADAQLVQGVAGWNVAVANRFTSDAFILFQNRLSFRDENQLAWQIDRPLGTQFHPFLRGRAAWFTQSRVFSQEVTAAMRYHPQPHLWLEPAAGIAWDRRPGAAVDSLTVPIRMDTGPALGLRMNLSPPPIDGYLLHAEVDAGWQFINPRRGRAVRFGGSAQRTFDPVRLGLEVGYVNYRRDAYQAVSFLNRDEATGRLSETVEATTSDTLLARLHAEAPLYPGLSLTTTLDLTTNNRSIRALRTPENALFFDTDFNRRAFEGQVGLVYEHPRYLLRVAVRGGAEVENRQLTNRDELPPTQAAQKGRLLQQADYDAGFFALETAARASLGRTILTLNTTSTILRHDTPLTNLDDRDELYQDGRLGARFVLSRYLLADVQVFGTYYHTVYLNAARSAENNVQRSLRLRPALEWTLSEATRFRLGTELRATYTVADFVLPGRRPTDQSARELRYDATFEHDFGGGLRLYVQGSRSDLHLGRLLWDRFAEIPSDTLRTYSGWIHVTSQTIGNLVADVGVRFFIRSDYDRATTVRYARLADDGTVLHDELGNVIMTSLSRPGRERIDQIGPTCALTLPLRNASALRLDGWLNVQRVWQHLYGDLPEATADHIRRSGRRGTRKIIPNLSLTVLWNL